VLQLFLLLYVPRIRSLSVRPSVGVTGVPSPTSVIPHRPPVRHPPLALVTPAVLPALLSITAIVVAGVRRLRPVSLILLHALVVLLSLPLTAVVVLRHALSRHHAVTVIFMAHVGGVHQQVHVSYILRRHAHKSSGTATVLLLRP